MTDRHQPAVDRISRARLSLEGLSLGDAFGKCFMEPSMSAYLKTRT